MAIVCLMASVLLTGCGSSPSVRYFSLSSTVTGSARNADDAVVLGLGPMRIAEYLNRPQMVTRGEGSEVLVDEFSRWAEPLEQAVHRTVATDIDHLMDGVTVIVFPWESAVQDQIDYRLLGEISHFDADATGRVVLETQWSVVAAQRGVLVVQPRRTRYEVSGKSPVDPAAVALAMSEALAMFSNDIAGKLQAVIKAQVDPAGG
jgi:uncharacterized lipoprotein YmbA